MALSSRSLYGSVLLPDFAYGPLGVQSHLREMSMLFAVSSIPLRRLVSECLLPSPSENHHLNCRHVHGGSFAGFSPVTWLLI